MPAFTFEKIPAPTRIESGSPVLSIKQRGKLGRLVDRLTEMRLQSYDARSRRRRTTTASRKTKKTG